jgi:hypothetical protein
MEVTKTMMIDIADLSRSLDAGIGEYLRPEETGWYLPYDLEPTLKEGRPYYVHTANRGLTKVELITAPKGVDVYDQHADIIVTAEQTRALKERSYPHPARAIKLLKACANHLVDIHAAWGGIYEEQHRRETQERGEANAGYSTIRKQVEEVLDEYGLLELAKIDESRMHPSQVHYLKERAKQLRKLPSKEVRRDEARNPANLNAIIAEFVYPQYEGQDDILTMIEDHLLDFKTTILDFLGKDKWIMHFLKVSRGSLIVEKTVDYRIYSWMVEHGYWDRSH